MTPVYHDAAAVESLQSYLTLSDPMNYSQPGSFVHGILQARMLEWVAISFSTGSSDPGIEPRSPALQTDSLLSEPLGKLLRILEWVGFPFSKGSSDPGIEPGSPTLQVDSLPTEL